MKPVKSSIAALSLLCVLSLSGCAKFYDRHPTTESGYRGALDQEFWGNREWRKAISAEWRKEDRRLSRVRLGEFID